MRFKGLDLNLLVALDALLELRSVSRAAERMNLTQPAMSAALSRLREYFGDQLLVVHGKAMYPTAFADSLLPQVREALGGIEALIATAASFDPATSERSFRIVASDYIAVSVLVPLVARLAEESPRIRLEILSPGDTSSADLATGKVDLLLTPAEFINPPHPTELLFEERHLLIGWSGNPLFAREITEADFSRSGHVAVAFGSRGTASFADRQLQMLSKHRRIEVTAASFTIVPWLIKDTMRLALLHERLVSVMQDSFPIAHAPVPFAFPLMKEMVQFHETRAADQGLSWLRREIASVAASIPLIYR